MKKIIEVNLKDKVCGAAHFDLLFENEAKQQIGLRDLHSLIFVEIKNKMYSAINLDYGIIVYDKSPKKALNLLVSEIWKEYLKYIFHNSVLIRKSISQSEEFWKIYNPLINIGRYMEQKKGKEIILKNDKLKEKLKSGIINSETISRNIKTLLEKESKKYTFTFLNNIYFKKNENNSFKKQGFVILKKNAA